MTNDDIDYLRKKIINEDSLFTNRINLLFVAESMLFISYFTALGIINKIPSEMKILLNYLIIFGIISNIFFMFVLWRQSNDIGGLKNKLENLEEIEKKEKNNKISKEIKESRNWGSANIILSQLLTSLFLFIWIIFGWITSNNFIICVIVPIFSLFLLIIYQLLFKNLRVDSKRKFRECVFWLKGIEQEFERKIKIKFNIENKMFLILNLCKKKFKLKFEIIFLRNIGVCNLITPSEKDNDPCSFYIQ
jgi:hypothetical protein